MQGAFLPVQPGWSGGYTYPSYLHRYGQLGLPDALLGMYRALTQRACHAAQRGGCWRSIDSGRGPARPADVRQRCLAAQHSSGQHQMAIRRGKNHASQVRWGCRFMLHALGAQDTFTGWSVSLIQPQGAGRSSAWRLAWRNCQHGTPARRVPGSWPERASRRIRNCRSCTSARGLLETASHAAASTSHARRLLQPARTLSHSRATQLVRRRGSRLQGTEGNLWMRRETLRMTVARMSCCWHAPAAHSARACRSTCCRPHPEAVQLRSLR